VTTVGQPEPLRAESIGSRIRRYRTDAGLNLSQLAEASGVSKSYLWNLENRDEDKHPSAKVLFTIAKALSVSMADLLGQELTFEGPATLDPALAEFAQLERLPNSDVQMLASIEFRGDAPRSVERWRYIYQAIRTSRQLDDAS
jgi:transcriptional regulator with XRE-family HTH domain